MANKKINQLVSKTAILSTDLFGIGDATTGQLFKKTIAELQAAIGGAVISVNGLVGTVVLDTDDVQELASPTNKYFTDARARGAISLTVTGNSGASTYSSGTGVLNVPTYTLAGLGGITASFLSGTSGISYNSTTGVISYSGTVYTDASIRALFSGSTGITYNSSTGAISYSGTVYTDSSVRALISLTTTGTSGASTYNNTTGVINVPEYTLAGLGGISLTSLSGGTGITYNNTTGAISYSGTVYTDASVRALFSASGSVSYNNTTGVISLTGGNLTEATSSVLTITGGSGAVIGGGTSIQVKQATTSVSGFLSSTDWTTFNNKQSTITLTTTGTSGAATFSSNTLNIPQYQSVLTNPVTGTGTSGYVAYWNGSGSIAGSANHFWDNTNGRLGIGTATPGAPLSVVGNTSGYTLYSIGRNNADNASVISFRSNSASTEYAWIESGVNSQLDFGTNGNYRMRITSAGNVGIGTSSPKAIFETGAEAGRHVALNSEIASLISNNAYYSAGWKYRYTGTAAYMNFNSGAVTFANASSGSADATISWVEQMKILTNGNVNVKTRINVGIGDNASNYLYMTENEIGRTGNADFFIQANNTGKTMMNVSGGNILMGTQSDNGERLYVSGNIRATGSITANSDISLKKNLLKIENALEKVEQINGYTYELKEDDSKRHAGVIAQEIQGVLPEIVNTGNDGLMGVEYGNISALLIEAIKEQNTKIKNLETLLASK